MARINKNKLPNNELKRLIQQFDSILTPLNKNVTSQFFDEILGTEERIMLAKRLAAIILLREGYSDYRVARILKLSPSTTGKIAEGVHCGAYKQIISHLCKDKRVYLSILDTIDSILHLGGFLPHRVGLDRYRNL